MLTTSHLKAYWPFEGNANDDAHGTPPNDNLVGFWPLNETSGTNAPDESGNGNDGTITTPVWASGISGNALKADQVSIPDADVLDISDNISISLWMKIDSYHTNYAETLGKQTNTTDSQFNMYLFGDYEGNGDEGRLRFYGTAGGSWKELSALTGKLNLDQWYHIVWVYNSTIGGQLYLDGEAYGGLTRSGTLATNNQSIISGLVHEYIDEVRIYNKALTADEVKALHDFPAGGNHGTVYGASLTTGKFGKCYSFDGVDDYIDLPILPLSAAGDFTVGAWINRASLTSDEGTETVVSLEESVGYCRLEWGDSDNTLYGYFNDGSSHHFIGKTVISSSEWYHVAYTKSGNNFAFYVNGILKGTDTGSINAGDGIEAIGCRANGTGYDYNWNGLIDQVQIYNKALSQSDIKRIMLGFHPLNG